MIRSKCCRRRAHCRLETAMASVEGERSMVVVDAQRGAMQATMHRAHAFCPVSAEMSRLVVVQPAGVVVSHGLLTLFQELTSKAQPLVMFGGLSKDGWVHACPVEARQPRECSNECRHVCSLIGRST